MEFDTVGLSHSPEFELPDHAAQYPADLLSLIEEKAEGLHRIIVQKFVRRGKYSQVATLTCQENAGRKNKPVATPEQIAEYCMLLMQYDVDKTDEHGKYKCTLYGGMSKGRWEVSKHVDLSDGDGEARSVSIMSEGDMLEQQQQYIGELHQTNIAMLESLHGIVKPLLQENKEMMKIVSESQKRLAEIERDRLRHDLELRMHQDDIKQRESEEEHKMERWRELLKIVNETGAPEAIFKAVVSKLREKSKDKKEKENEKKTKKEEIKEKEKEPIQIEHKKKKKKLIDLDSAKTKNKEKQKEKTEPEETPHEEIDTKEIEKIFFKEGLQKVSENPLVFAAEALKMSVDEKKQWSKIRETLNGEQYDLFEEICAANNDGEIRKRLRALWKMKGMRNLLKLQDLLDETQTKFVEILMKAATE